MSTDARHKLAELGTQIRALLKEKEALKMENARIQEELQALKTKVEQEKLLRNQQEENNNLINIAKHMERSGEDKETLKEKIDAYLTYIDKCLEILKK